MCKAAKLRAKPLARSASLAICTENNHDQVGLLKFSIFGISKFLVDAGVAVSRRLLLYLFALTWSLFYVKTLL
jgi:hypothetical protein